MTYTTNGHTPGAEQRIAIDPATGMPVGYQPSPLDLPPPPSEQAAPPPPPVQSSPPPTAEAPKPTIGQRVDKFFSRPKREKPQPATTVTNATTQVELVGQRVEMVTREVAIEVDATAWGRWVNEPSGRVVAGALLGWGLRRWIPWLAGAGMFSVASGVSLGVAIIMHGHRFMRPAMAQRLGVIVLIASISLQISPPRPNFAIPQWVQHVLYGSR
jgi:hypothetical protein